MCMGGLGRVGCVWLDLDVQAAVPTTVPGVTLGQLTEPHVSVRPTLLLLDRREGAGMMYEASMRVPM